MSDQKYLLTIPLKPMPADQPLGPVCRLFDTGGLSEAFVRYLEQDGLSIKLTNEGMWAHWYGKKGSSLEFDVVCDASVPVRDLLEALGSASEDLVERLTKEGFNLKLGDPVFLEFQKEKNGKVFRHYNIKTPANKSILVP